MNKKGLPLFLGMSCALIMASCAGDAETVSDTETQEILQSDNTPLEDTDGQTEASEAKQEAEDSQDMAETETIPENEGAAEAEHTSVFPEKLSDDLYDFQISIDGTVYQFPMWYTDLEALGWEYAGDSTETLSANQYTSNERWEKDGAVIHVSFANLSMNTAAFSDCSVVGIALDRNKLADCDWEILLPGGIKWGVSGIEDIKAAYGDPTSDFGGSDNIYYKMTYQYDTRQEIHLFVYTDTGVLQQIELRNFVELAGADNSVSDEVPDLVKNYQAPSEVGNDFYAFHFDLEGNLYTMPCPVSALIENGFVLDEEKSDQEIGAGQNGRAILRYNNQTLRAQVVNYADYATVVANCFVTQIESGNLADFALVIPGNIQIGSSETDVQKAVEAFHVEQRTTDSGFTYYTVSPPDGSALNRYTITIKDGNVIGIEVRNDILDD